MYIYVHHGVTFLICLPNELSGEETMEPYVVTEKAMFYGQFILARDEL